MGAEQCCKAIQNGNEYTHNFDQDESTNKKKQITLYMGMLQQLASINYQIKNVRSNQIYLNNISNFFHSIDQILQIIDTNYAQMPPLLTSMQSKICNLKSPCFDSIQNKALLSEFCIVTHQRNKQSQARRESSVYSDLQDLKSKLKILQLLKVTEQELQNQKKFIKSLITSLRAIPESQSFFWDIQSKNALSQMSKYLIYKLPSYIEFVNSYLSLNDPISLLNTKYLIQIGLKFMASSIQVTQEVRSKVYLTDMEKMLLVKGRFLMTVNFMKFQKEQKGKQRTSGQFYLILKDKKPYSFRIRHESNIYLLPLTLFQITEIVADNSHTKFYLKQLEEQPLLNTLSQFESKSNSDVESRSNYVAIHQLNLLSQLQSLSKKHKNNLDKYIDQVKLKNECQQTSEKSEFIQLIHKSYINYLDSQEVNQSNFQDQDQLKSQITKIKQIQATKVKAQTLTDVKENEQILQVEVIEPSLISDYQLKQMSNVEIKRCEKALTEYIKRLKLQKLQNQLLTVDIFYNLTTLNLSHCYLQFIDHLDCFPNLKELFLYSNEITKIQGLESNVELRLLSLSRNRIEKLQNIEHLTHLRQLYVTKNKLRRDSAQYLIRKEFNLLRKLAVSFVGQQEDCFELLCKEAPFTLTKLIINQSQFLQMRTQNKLKKRFKGALIEFCH